MIREKIVSDNKRAAPLPMLYSRAETAENLSISLRQLDYMIAMGRLAVVRIDKRTLISSWELLSFLDEIRPRSSHLYEQIGECYEARKAFVKILDALLA